MTDDMVKMCRRLSKYAHAQLSASDLERIADRIEELEAKLAKLEAAAQKAVGHITGYGEASTARIELRTALEELTGGKDG